MQPAFDDRLADNGGFFPDYRGGFMQPGEIRENLTALNSAWQEYKTKSLEKLDGLEKRLNQLEGDLDAGRGGGGSSGNEQKQWGILRRFLAEGGKSQSAPNDWMAASSAEWQELERKAIAIGDPATGGHAVPEVMERQITRRMAEVNAIRALSRVVQVTTAPSSYKVPISLGGTASGWVGENDSRTATASPAFTAPSFPDGELYAYPTSSSWALDDIPNLQRFLQDEVADVFAAAEATAFLTGNATKKPKGILDETPVTTADDASPMRDPFALKYTPLDPGSSPSDGIQADEIITLAHDLPAGYWPNATWLMSRPTLAAVRKLKDSYGQYLWTPSLSPGNPSQLLGLPVAISDAMAAAGGLLAAVLHPRAADAAGRRSGDRTRFREVLLPPPDQRARRR